MKVRSFRLYSATFLATLLNWNRNRRLRSLALAMLLTVLTGGLAWHLTIRATASGTISLTTLGSAYTQNFDTLPSSGSATWTNDSTIPGWYHARTGTGTTIVANDGSSNAGNLYSYGTGTATDRALGSVGSGNAAAGNFFWGVRLANNTGSTITSLNVSYTGEQWRNSAAAAQTVAFSYLVGSPTVTGSLAEFQTAGVAVTGLDFTSPITGSTAGPLNGNSAANRTAISFNITGLSIPNGTEVMLRWSDPDHTGSDHGLAIDDFSVTPNGAAALPDLTINDVSLNEGDAGTTTFAFTVSLSAPAGAGGVTFDIATADNTATQPSDYTQKSLTGQTIPAGSSTYTFTVLVNGDTAPEPNETFFVNVTNVTGANVTDGQGQGTIVNDDAAPNLTINDVSLNEGDAGTTTFTFTVSLSTPAPAGGVTFDIATQDNTATQPSDYTQKSLTGQTIPAASSTYTFDVLVNGDTTPETNETFFVNVTNVTNAIVVDGQGQGTIVNDDFTPIHDIQGSGNTSPLVGNSVTTQGIVTGVKSNGFYIQEPDATIDADPNTSEGIFVFTSSAPPAPAAVGNRVQVVGTVQEFITSSDPLSPPVTEIAGSPTVTLVSTGNPLPAPITLTSSDTGMGGVNVGSIENLERYEGMRVKIVSLTVVAPTQGNLSEANATSTTNGVFYGVIAGVARPFREPGIQANDPVPAGSGVTIPPVPRFDFNPERLRVDSDSLTGAVALDVTSGATVSNLVGPLDYAFRTYTILADPPTVTPTPTVSGNISAMPVPVPLSHEFTVASFNMERFFDTVNDAGVSDVALTVTAFNNRLNKASLAIRNVLRFPDIIGVEEMENLTTLQAVAAKVSADAIAASQPDPMYQAYLVEGNDVGGIDVGFLVKAAPVFGSTPRVTVNDVVQEGKTTLFVNPDSSTALLNDRPSLRLMAVINHPSGYAFPLTVIVNHLRSLSGVDDTTAGTNGWATEGDRVRAKRRAQAEFLANLIQARQMADPTERIVSIGDYNAFQVNDGYVDSIGTIKGTPTPADQVVLASSDLVNPDLIELLDFAPADQRYSFSFDGTAQVLDHELITQNLLPRFSHLNFARNNADFPEVYRTDPNRPERISDHDMPVAYFTFPPDLTLTKMHSGDFTIGSAGQYLLTVSNAASAGPTSSTITVDDTLPSNLTLASFSGTGWSCTGTGTANVSCTYAGPPTNPALAAGASLPQLTLTVNVGSGTPSSITNMATVSTPDEVNTADNTASDPTIVMCPTITAMVSGGGPICAGNSATVTVTVSGGTAPYTVTLDHGGGMQMGSGPTFNFMVSPSMTTVYLAMATDVNGCSAMVSGSATVTFNPLPDATITAPTAVCANSPNNMASVPDAGMSATYSWMIINGTITSATNIRNITFTANSTSPITLNVTVTSGAGCSSMGSQNITVNPLPDATITAPTQVCATSTGNMASVPDAGMSATYSWSIINGTITSATNIRNITFTAGSTSPVTLNVTVTSGAGCAKMNSQNLTVNPLATVNAGPDQSVSTGSPTVTLVGMVGGGATSGTWSGGTGSFNPSATTLNAMYTPSPAEIAAGSVTLTLTTNDPAGPCGAVSDTLTINISALPIDKFSAKITDPAVCTGPGNVVSVTAEVTNPNPTPQTATFTATLQPGLIALPGTCATTVNPGGCTITPPSSVTWSGMLAANQTVTITYQAQLANGTPPGTTLCIDSSTTIAGSTAMVQACTMINCPQVGPGQAPPVAAAISDQKPGSVLIYNFYTSNPTDLTRQNTRINITNTDPARSVAVHLFFVDGNTCTPADAFLCLTPNQTTSFLASDFDPGTSGYIVAVAVDERGCPLNFNFLIGDEFIKLSSGHQANIGAEAVAAIAGGLPVCDALANTATLAFDGVSYNQMPRVLAVDNFPSQANGNQTQLIINRIGGNLLSGAGRVGGLFGVLYDEAEQPLSFTLTSDLCQFRGTLNQSLRVVSGGLNQAVPVGHSGWLRLWAVQDEGLLGVVLNANPNAGAAAVNQGHNLHKLTFTSAASFVMPIIPPRCQ